MCHCLHPSYFLWTYVLGYPLSLLFSVFSPAYKLAQIPKTPLPCTAFLWETVQISALHFLSIGDERVVYTLWVLFSTNVIMFLLIHWHNALQGYWWISKFQIWELLFILVDSLGTLDPVLSSIFSRIWLVFTKCKEGSSGRRRPWFLPLWSLNSSQEDRYWTSEWKYAKNSEKWMQNPWKYIKQWHSVSWRSS